MGTLTLNTDLDSALHILNYCLSSSSPSVQPIFKYHIQCLEQKMLKIQKTVAVVSPLPVSNSFACLEVEHVEDECTLDFTPPHVSMYVKSREGPQKGLAGDSKKVVLNSLLTPFDVSKSPKSISTKELVLKLRRSVTIKSSVLKSSPVQSFCPNFRQLATGLVAKFLKTGQLATELVATGCNQSFKKPVQDC